MKVKLTLEQPSIKSSMILNKEKCIKQCSLNASGAKSYALAEEPNPKNRPYMEDSTCWLMQLPSSRIHSWITARNPFYSVYLTVMEAVRSVIIWSKTCQE